MTERLLIIVLGIVGAVASLGPLAWAFFGPTYDCVRTETRHVEEEPPHMVLHTGIDPMTGQLHQTVGLDPGHPAYTFTECVEWVRRPEAP